MSEAGYGDTTPRRLSRCMWLLGRAILFGGLLLLVGCGKSSAPPAEPVAKVSGAKEEDTNPAPSTAGDAVDLLRKYKIEDSVLYGKAHRDNWVLFTEITEGATLVKIPMEPSMEYDLEAVVTRLDGVGSLLLGIVLPKGHCLLKVDSWPKQGHLSALDSVDGKRPGYKTYPAKEYKGQVLPLNKEVTLVCRVRKDAVTLSANGQSIVDYREGLERLTFPRQYKLAAQQRAFYVGGAGSRLKISKLQLRPLGPTVPLAVATPVRDEWSVEPPPTPAGAMPGMVPGMPNPGGLMGPGGMNSTPSLVMEGNELVANMTGPIPIMHLVNARRLDGDCTARVRVKIESIPGGSSGQMFPALFGIRSVDPLARPAIARFSLPSDPASELTLVVRRQNGDVTTEFNGRRVSTVTPPQFPGPGKFFIQVPTPSIVRVISCEIDQRPDRQQVQSPANPRPAAGQRPPGSQGNARKDKAANGNPPPSAPPRDTRPGIESRTIVRRKPPAKAPHVLSSFEDWEVLATGQAAVDEKLADQISLERDDRGLRVLIKSELRRTVWIVNRNRVDGDFLATIQIDSATTEAAREAGVGSALANVGIGQATETGIGKGRTVGTAPKPGVRQTFRFQRIGPELQHQLDGKAAGTASNIPGPLVAGFGVTRSGLFWITDYQVKPLPGPVSSAESFVGQPVQEVSLLGKVTDAFLGGHGRYLVLRLSGPARVVVYDLDTMSQVQEMPLEDAGSLLTASARYLLVYSPRIARLFRFRLPDLSQPEIKPWNTKEPLTGIYAGCSSSELLMVETRVDARRATPIFLDLETLEPAGIVINAPLPIRWSDNSIVRSSADGLTFGIQGTPSATLLQLRGNTAAVRQAESFVKLALPSAEGETVFTDRFSNQPIRNARFEPVLEDGIQRQQPAVPAVRQPFYLSVYTPSSWNEEDVNRGHVSLQMLPHVRPLATFSDLTMISPSNNHFSKQSPLTLDKRLFCDPIKGQIVCLPYSDDRLLVKQFDLESLLKNSTLDYLLVTSEPPAAVEAGQTYQYRLSTLARQRAAGFRSGAEGHACFARWGSDLACAASTGRPR